MEQASSPHELLLAATADEKLAHQLEAALQKAELAAIETARPTPGAAESIAASIATNRVVAIVSNNYAEAVSEYLNRHGLSAGVRLIEGRNPSAPSLMKPDPHLIETAMRTLHADPEACVFIGDQTTDIEAGRAARISTIGYANKPGKVEALQNAGADAIVTTMLALASALR